MQKKIVIDVQHMGKTHHPLDRGAVIAGYAESDLCLQYASYLYRLLTENTQYYPYLITHGTYGQRAAFANTINADLYLACHLNSSETPPETPYSLIEISHYSSNLTRNFADDLKVSFLMKLPVKKSYVWTIKNENRGWTCINRVKAPALLLEPLFINDEEQHEHLSRNMSLIAECIYDTIITSKHFKTGDQ